MRGRFAVTLVMLVACASCFTPGSSGGAYVGGPVIDRCLEYLNPYAPVRNGNVASATSSTSFPTQLRN